MGIDLSVIEQARRDIVSTAQAMLEAKVSYIDGARQILGLAASARLDRFEDPLVPFVAIESETDEVPLADARVWWSAETLARHKPEWDDAERYAASVGEQACRELIAWLPDRPII